MSYGILSKNAFVLGGYVLGDFAIGDSVLDSTQEAIQLKREGFIILAMGDFNVRIGRVPRMEWNTPDTNDN